MVNKHMKICSILYVIRELQIKTRYYYTPVRMVETPNTHGMLSKLWSNRNCCPVQFSQFSRSIVSLCNPMNCSMPGLP